MAVTWTIATLERNTADDGVVVAHWRSSARPKATTQQAVMALVALHLT